MASESDFFLNDALQSLIQAAATAVQQGRWGEGELLWRKVLAAEPENPQALYSLGVHAFKRGQLTEATTLLQAAHAMSPNDPTMALSLSVVRRESGDAAGEVAAIDAALAADPYFLPALLAKGDVFERLGRRKAAAVFYGNALKVAPPQSQWPSMLRSQLEQARAAVERNNAEFTAFLAEHTDAKLIALTPFETERWREAGAILTGRSHPYLSDCTRLYVPRLPAIPFFDRAAFPWVEAVESRTEAIASELLAVLAEQEKDFKPYVAYAPGTPINQWQELNHSQRWSSYFFWQNGQPIAERLQHCPETAAALAAADMADIGGLCPNAMFSALAPKTQIPPHQGETNARLVVHLPLIVPENCTYRVGYERRRWTVGEVLIFDDSIEHEARNDSDELRVVLIFDVWNPLLSAGERDMVRALATATRDYQSQV